MGNADSTMLRSTERTMVIVRWFAVLFAIVQVANYYLPYPRGVESWAWAVVAMIAAGNVVIMACHMRWRAPEAVVRLSIASLAFDFVAVFAFVSIYTFDVNTAIFALVYLLPLEGAARFQRRGALLVMAAATIAYAVREYVGSRAYGYDFLLTSISFRMGIGFLIAAVAGSATGRLVTARRRTEELLHHEREASSALRELDELRHTFLTAVSHELRTPLTSVMGFAMTLDNVAVELTDEHRSMLDHVVTQSMRLDRLLGDLLDLQRDDSSPLQRTSQDVGALVRRATESVQLLTADRTIEIACESMVARVDAEKVERIVENLILNAVKYTPATSPIWIRVRGEGDGDDHGVLIAVDDDGPGVPDEIKLAVFEPFQRGTGELQHAPGTGIGLSLVARFTGLHGGRAWVEDAPGGGASFRVFLPD